MLEQFMREWLAKRPLLTPTDSPINIDGSLHGVVLFRKGPFQVQLFIVAPNSEIPDHVHPNVDSFEVYLSGEMAFRKNGVYVTKWEDAEKLPGFALRVKPDDPHGGTFGPKGGAFLSIQHWLNGVKPSSVGNDWEYRGEDRAGKSHIPNPLQATLALSHGD